MVKQRHWCPIVRSGKQEQKQKSWTFWICPFVPEWEEFLSFIHLAFSKCFLGAFHVWTLFTGIWWWTTNGLPLRSSTLEGIQTRDSQGASLVVQRLRLRAPNIRGSGSMPGQGTRAHMPQLKDPICLNDTLCSQININIFKNKLKIKRQGPYAIKWEKRIKAK